MQVSILGSPSLYVNAGSFLQLECMISHVVSPPQFVMWEHGGRVVPGETVNIQGRNEVVTKSLLSIDKVNSETVGLYSCMPDNISPATIKINIVKNKEELMAVLNSSDQICCEFKLIVYLLLTIVNM